MGVDAEMAVVTPTLMTDRELLRLSYETVAAFGHEEFMISRGGDWGGPHHALVWGTNNYDLSPQPETGSTISVNLFGRFYGIGYERGDLPLIFGLARWFRTKLPGCSVYYGGDSGESLALLDDEAEKELWDHFCTHQHFPYINHSMPGQFSHERPHCETCDEPLIRHGWGRSYAAYHCPGCGWRQITTDQGKTWSEKDEVFA